VADGVDHAAAGKEQKAGRKGSGAAVKLRW
jgi:hypothetical protein